MEPNLGNGIPVGLPTEILALNGSAPTTPSTGRTERTERQGMVMLSGARAISFTNFNTVLTEEKADDITRTSVTLITQGKQTTLNLDHLGFAVFPNSFTRCLTPGGAFAQLRILNCNNNQLTTLPPGLKYLKSLEEFNAEHNRLKEFSSELTELVSLRRIHLGFNQISSLPSEISQLINLTRLFLENNLLVLLPPDISKLQQLKWLSLDGNQLNSLPTEIGKLTKLGWLSVEGNRLETIPNEIGQLVNLESLSLLDNPTLTHLPKTIAQLTRLTDLRINTSLRLNRDVLAESAKGIVNYLDGVIKAYNLPFDSKGHWEPDEKCNQCTKCNVLFTFTTRRHHCRLCGRIFCKKCCCLSLDVLVMGSVRVCDVCLGLMGSNLPALAMKDEPQLEIEYGLTDEEEDTLSLEEKKKKLNEQLRELNQLIDAAARKKDGFQRLLAAYEKDNSSTGDTTMLLREKARQEFAGQERVVMDLVESQIKLLKMIEDLDVLADPSASSSPTVLSTPLSTSGPSSSSSTSHSIIIEDPLF